MTFPSQFELSESLQRHKISYEKREVSHEKTHCTVKKDILAAERQSRCIIKFLIDSAELRKWKQCRRTVRCSMFIHPRYPWTLPSPVILECFPPLLSLNSFYPCYPWRLSIPVILEYFPPLLSLNIFHPCYPWIFSTPIILEYFPLLLSLDTSHPCYPWIFSTPVILVHFPPLLSLNIFHPCYPWIFSSLVILGYFPPLISLDISRHRFHQEILAQCIVIFQCSTCRTALFPSLQAFSISSILVRTVKWARFQYSISIFQYHLDRSEQ